MNNIYKTDNLVLLINNSANQEKFVIAKRENNNYFLINEEEELIENISDYLVVKVAHSDVNLHKDSEFNLRMVFESNIACFDYLYVEKIAGESKRKVTVSKDMNIYLNYFIEKATRSRMGIIYISKENLKKLENKLNFDLKYIPFIVKNRLNDNDFNCLKKDSDKIAKENKKNKKR